jgi:hypothetical protein
MFHVKHGRTLGEPMLIEIIQTITRTVEVETSTADVLELATAQGYTRNEGEDMYDFIDRVWDARDTFLSELLELGAEAVDEDIEYELENVAEEDGDE